MSASPAVETPGTLAPIVIELPVPCPPHRAFDYFTRDIARWWPLASHSVGEEDAASVQFEPRVGGRLFETLKGGETHLWGTVTAWRPGEAVAFSWHPGRDPSTAQWIEVAFAAHPQGTRVTLTHGGWERLGEGGSAKRAQYAGGWKPVFEAFGGFCRPRPA